MSLLGYKLSKETDADLEEIFDYSENEFGIHQAITYLSDLESVFNRLVIHLELGRKRNEIKTDLFSILEQEHIIFYRILENNIRIIRVLYGSKDLPKNFK